MLTKHLQPLSCAILTTLLGAHNALASEDFSDVSLEALLDFKVETPATLTSTTQRVVPAAVTTITQADIRASGARSLDELLEIYVPGFLIMTSGINDNIGMRGIINDRNNKILLAVNGQVLNHRVNDGHGPERMLSLLGDIEGVDIIRGPGSATYGPGAIAGIINIRTLSATGTKGTHLSVRSGQKEKFRNLEFTQGHQWSKEHGVVFYAGIDQYEGAKGQDAPVYIAESLNRTIKGQTYTIKAGEPLPFPVANHGRAYQDLPRKKLFTQYSYHDFDMAVRYTAGGESRLFAARSYKVNDPFTFTDREIGYEQISGQINYVHTFNDYWTLKNTLEYATNDSELHISNGLGDANFRSWRENQTKIKVFAGFTPNPQHDIALGTEYSANTQGDNATGFPYLTANVNPRVQTLITTGTIADKRWVTWSAAIVGEWQWKISDSFTSFLGGRLDDHKYTGLLSSPRLSLVYELGENHTLKALYNRSVRRSEESDMLEKYVSATRHNEQVASSGIGEYRSTDSAYDKIDSLELRYDWQVNKALKLTASPHYAKHEAVGFASNATSSDVKGIGTMTLQGLDFEVDYSGEHWQLFVSHSLIDMVDFELSEKNPKSPDYIFDQHYSAKPYGYGNDLANWSDSTKLVAQYKPNDRWALSTSLRYFWGFAGAEDMANFSRQSNLQYQTNADGSLKLGANGSPLLKANQGSANGFWSLPTTDAGFDEPFDARYFFNFGVKYQATDRLAIHLDGFNLNASLVDEKSSIRNNHRSTDLYRSLPTAYSLSIYYDL
jgi:outer membrane receptor protein involved in Fe transport